MAFSVPGQKTLVAGGDRVTITAYDPRFLDVDDHDDDHDDGGDGSNDGLPAYSHHDKIPPWWEYVSNYKGGNVSVSKSHHT